MICFIPAPFVHAISFDIWHTGMSRQEILNVAMHKNLPLAKGGLIHSSKEFNPRLVSGNVANYYYRTVLFENLSEIILLISPEKSNYQQTLYEIEVRFIENEKNKGLFPYVLKVLEERYGQPKIENKIFLKNRIWRPDADSEVRLISNDLTIRIKYTDLKIKKFAEELSRSTYELPKTPGEHKDAGKF